LIDRKKKTQKTSRQNTYASGCQRCTTYPPISADKMKISSQFLRNFLTYLAEAHRNDQIIPCCRRTYRL